MTLFWYLSIALLILLLARLVCLEHRPPFLAAYLLSRLIQSGGLLYIGFGSDAYRQFWLVSEVVSLMTLALAVFECHLMITREIYELGSIGKVVALGAIGLAGGIALSTGANPSVQWGPITALALQAKRSLLTFLMIALGAVVWFYHRFPIPVASHVRPHTWVFIAYLAFHSVGYWGMVALGVQWTPLLDEVLAVVWCSCLAAWLWIYAQPWERKMRPTEEKLNEANRRARQMERTVGQ